MSNLKQKRFVDTDYLNQQLDITMQQVEGSNLSITDSKMGYINDLEILGNTIQNAEDLADIRSVGDKVEGQELYEIPVLSCGKNLFDGKLEYGTISMTDGTDVISGIALRSDFIEVKPPFTFSRKSTLGHLGFRYYDKDKNFIGTHSYDGLTYTFSNANIKYFRFVSADAVYSNEYQLEEGTQATPYEPYVEDKLTILSPVQLEKVGDVADRIICKDGVWGVEKNIETIVIDGSDKFGYWLASTQPTDSTLINIYVSKVLTYGKTNGILICDKFVYTDSIVGGNCYTGGSGNMHFILPKTTFGDANVFKAWLQSNHTTVMYQLAQPQFIPLPHDLQIKLRTFAGQTNIHFETEIEPTIKAQVPKSIGASIESLVNKSESTDKRLEIIENVAEGQNMQYSTDNGIIHCKNTKKGKVKDLVIEGNTLVNYAKDGSKTLTLNGEIDEKGTFITTTEAVNNGLVDVAIEGETLVNVCDQKDPVAITKSYTVENTNHVPLQGEYDGKCRPVVEGKTLVNINRLDKFFVNHSDSIENGVITISQGTTDRNIATLKTNTPFKVGQKYTIVVDILENTLNLIEDNTTDIVVGVSELGLGQGQYALDLSSSGQALIKHGQVGRILIPATGTDVETNVLSHILVYANENNPSGHIKFTWQIFEGDLTANPPSGYIEGLKSSFEDQLIPQNLVDSVNNNVSNPSLYSVLASHKNGEVKPSTTYTIYVKNKSNTLIKMYGNEHLFKDEDRNVHVNSNSYTVWKGTTVDTLPDSNALLKLGYEFNDTVNMEVMFLEGDYTSNPPTYEEVVNYGGKYKVEYKVTGKNKYTIDHIPTECWSSIVKTNNVYEVQPTQLLWTDGINFVPKKGQIYTMSAYIKVGTATNVRIGYVTSNGTYYQTNGVYSTNDFVKVSITTDTDVAFFRFDWSDIGTFYIKDLQIEEGETATEYEEYKEYTKTFYLNSPLLEGDTIEDVKGKATHVKRWAKIVLDGSETWTINHTMDNNTAYHIRLTNVSNETVPICDKFKELSHHLIDEVGTFKGSNNALYLTHSENTIEGLKQWLQSNPTTMVYKLASPIYETISEESILCDSYVNGHLDVNTNIPINRVKFNGWGTALKYIQSSTNYTIQFTSDNNGKLNYIGMNWKASPSYDVVKGINRFNVVVGDTINTTFFELNGIGFNASNISVVATEREFNYFEGLYSVGQDDTNGHNIEILSSNKNILSPIKNKKHPCFIKKGTRLVLSEKNNTPSLGGNVMLYDKHGNVQWFSIDSGTTTPRTITTWQDVHYIENALHLETGLEYQVEIGTERTPYTPHQQNAKTLTLKEPLRGLPNGVKDRVVKIGGKWYIERNCGEIVFNGSEDWKKSDYTRTKHFRSFLGIYDWYKEQTPTFNNTLPNDSVNIQGRDVEGVYVTNTFDIQVSHSKLNTVDLAGFKQWLQANPTTVVYQLATPTYEELEVEPVLTTYVDQTHISTNSVIPCDMTVKNSGYDVIIKPSTLYTVALDTNKSGEVELNLGGSKVTTNNGVAKVITPSTLVDDSLRISGKGLKSSNVRVLEGDNTHFIPSYFEGLKSSFEDTKQGDNHIVEVVSNNKNLFNCESIIKKDLVYSGASKSYRVVYSKIKQNTDYTVTGTFAKSTTTNGHGGIRIALYKDIPQEIDSWYQTQKSVWIWQTEAPSSDINKPFNSKDYNYVGVYVAIATGTANNYTATLTNLQLTEGGKVEYVEHTENKLQFSTLAPLRSVGAISDKLVYKDNKWMIERNCGEQILNGSESWGQYNSGSNRETNVHHYTCQLVMLDKVYLPSPADVGNLACDKYINVSANMSFDSDMECICDRTDSIRIKINRTKLKTQNVEGFKEYLSKNPVKLVYTLAQPYYEEIGEYRNLDSYDEGTTISTNSFIAPSHLGFKLSSHVSNIVKDVQDDVSDLKTWRSEIFDSITHKKTFDSAFAIVEDTKEGVVNEVKLEGKTLVNLSNSVNVTRSYNQTIPYETISNIQIGKLYTLIVKVDKNTCDTPLKFSSYEFCGGTKGVRLNGAVEGDYAFCPANTTGVFALKVGVEVYGENGKGTRLVIFNNDATVGEYTVSCLLLEGDHTQNPPSYFEGLLSAGQDVEEVSVESVDGNGNLIDETKITLKTLINENGTLITNEKSNLSDYIKVKNGDVFTVPSGLSSNFLGVALYNKNKNYIKSIPLRTPVDTPCTFTVDNDGYMRVTLWTTQPMMLFKGDKLKEYQPHQSDKKSLLYYNPTTSAWEKPILRQWDSIEKHSDGKYYYHKRSGEVVLNGSVDEEWIKNGSLSTGNYVFMHLQGQQIKPTNSMTDFICDKLVIEDYNVASGECISKYANGTQLVIKVTTSKLSTQDVAGFKAWLQANPTTIVYQLAQEEVYEVLNLELNSYDGETNIVVNSGAISPITTVSLTSSLPQVAENLRNRVRQLEEQIYDYQVVQNLRQLRTFYKSDYANFGVAVVTNSVALTSTGDITPYGYDLFELFKQIIEEGKDTYDRIELEEYIDFYVMTFIFDFEMAFELFEMIDLQHPVEEDFEIEDEPIVEEDSEIDVDMGVIPNEEDIDTEMGVIPDDYVDPDMGVIPEEEIDPEFGVDYEPPIVDEEIDVDMGVIPNEEDIDTEMEVVPNEEESNREEDLEV